MFQSWKLGRLFGIDIHVHWTFLFLPLLVLFNTLQVGSPGLLPYSLTLVGAAFGCVVLHELGHALAARRYGIGTRDITLYPIGGVARLERMPAQPWQEFWIAVAGPAVNVVIAAVLIPLVLLYGHISHDGAIPAAFFAGNLLLDLATINVILVVFNMLPAFPSDGGRVLRALLATRLDRVRATQIAANVGIVTAIGIALYGVLVVESFMPVVVAGFLVLMGRMELASERYRAWVSGHSPLTVLPADSVPADEVIIDMPARDAGTGYSGVLWDQRLGAWVVWRNGRPVQIYS